MKAEMALFIIVVLFFVFPIVYSFSDGGESSDGSGSDGSSGDTSGDTGGEGGDVTQPDENPQQAEAQEAVDTQSDYSGETPPDTDVTLSSGETVFSFRPA